MSRLLVLGALHHDVVVESPALPRVDETLTGGGVDYRFGGKGGNQAVAAARMGADVAMLGRVGADAAGQSVLEALDAAGVDRRGIRETGTATGMSVAISLPGGDYGAVIVSGANLENDGALPPGAAPDVALIQNEVPEAANLAFAEALPRTCQLIWNAAPARTLSPALAGRTDLLVVNRLEATDLAGTSDPRDAAADLLKIVRGHVIVTLGGGGLILAGGQGLSTHVAPAVDVVSTHGAGDMFIGALAALLGAGVDLGAAADFAQMAAALFISSDIARRSQITRDAVLAALP